MKKFIQEFKAFALRGNVMDMAIGMLIGLFIPGAVVQTVVILLLLLIGYNLFVC